MPENRPNVLLLIADQHRGDWLGLLKNTPIRTPNLDKLASRGVLFKNARTPSPVCAPARASLALGCEYDGSPVRSNRDALPLGHETFYSVLRDAGYDVRSVGKLDLLKPNMSWGADGQHNLDGEHGYAKLGFTGGRDSAGKHDGVKAYLKGIAEPYTVALAEAGLADAHAADYNRRTPAVTGLSPSAAHQKQPPPPPAFSNTDLSPIPDGMYCDDWVATSGLAELSDLCALDKPWCLVVNFSGPHEPLDVTQAMRENWQSQSFDMPLDNPGADLHLHQVIRQSYAAMIERIDHWCGQFIEHLENLGVFENTFVSYSADHGEMLGDANLWGKGVPHEASVHIPLICAGFGVEVIGRISTPVSWIDIGATCLDLAGAQAPKGTRAKSLLPELQGHDATRSYVFSGLGVWRSVFDGEFKLVAGFDQNMGPADNHFGEFNIQSIETAKMFHVASDPLDSTDIAAENGTVAQRLRDVLRAQVAGQ